MTGKAWGRCAGCNGELFRVQYEQVGKYLILRNGHQDACWFCTVKCLMDDITPRILEGPFKSRPLKPFGSRERVREHNIGKPCPSCKIILREKFPYCPFCGKKI